MQAITQLKELYARNSKHSNYQILSDKLALIIGTDQIKVKSRYEQERFTYIVNNISVEGKNILDIGGNSGFFTFETIAKNANKVHYYEGNKAHCDFVKLAAEVLCCIDKIQITNAYYEFEAVDRRKYDVVYLLNVLHHIGDDYGDKTLSIEAAKKQMINQLNSMAGITTHLVLQLGFNWKGNRNVCLFEHGTKKELIDYIIRAVHGIWEITKIGIPVRSGDDIKYIDLDNKNVKRDDSLGEFLNRPLFIMRSTQYT